MKWTLKISKMKFITASKIKFITVARHTKHLGFTGVRMNLQPFIPLLSS